MKQLAESGAIVGHKLLYKCYFKYKKKPRKMYQPTLFSFSLSKDCQEISFTLFNILPHIDIVNVIFVKQ